MYSKNLSNSHCYTNIVESHCTIVLPLCGVCACVCVLLSLLLA